MGSDSSGQSESGCKISTQLFNFLDVSNQSSINSLLCGFSLSSPLCLSILSFLSMLSSSLWSILQLVLCEVNGSLEECAVDVHSHAVQGDSGAGGDNVGSVHSLQGNSVDGIRTGNEDISGFQMLKNNNSSSSVGSWQEDDHTSGDNGFTTGAGSGLISSSSEKNFFIISRVPGFVTVPVLSLRGTSQSYVRNKKYSSGSQMASGQNCQVGSERD